MAGYEWEQLRKALATEQISDDPKTRKRASLRAGQWTSVLLGIASGRIRVGSRTPVRAFPVWLTPEIVRGGFATGAPAAGGPLTSDEIALADLVGAEQTRESLFDWFLSADGLRELNRMIDDGDYRLDLPEHGALLVAVYLLRVGQSSAAKSVVTTIRPWADRIRFWPIPSKVIDLPGVHVATVPEVADRLAAKRPQRQVEAAREALTVWAPFADRVVEHWWLTRGAAGVVGSELPDGWVSAGDELGLEYHRLAASHTLTSKHRDPKGSLQILLAGMRRAATSSLDESAIRRLNDVVAHIVAKRGEPNSPRLNDLRKRQFEISSEPSHAALAHDAAERLRAADIEVAGDPVALLEGAPGVHLDSVRSIARQATHAPIEFLLRAGIVRSAEMLAVLAPQLTGETVAGRYADPAAARLAKRAYLAFANRRSVLLLNHETQVSVLDVPWFSALEATATPDAGAGLAKAQAIALAGDVMRYFPGTSIPNSVVRELDRLLKLADIDAPLTYELASDIFMGSFSEVFQRAAQEAARRIPNTLYSSYYGIDYPSVAKFGVEMQPRPFGRTPRRTVPSFDALVRERAGVSSSGWAGVAENGMIIEQAQILTTHNLAQLVDLGVELDWMAQARSAWNFVRAHLSSTLGSKPLHHRKNAAFAWRQTVFFLSLAGREDVVVFLGGALTQGLAPEIAAWCEQILDGLRDVATGGHAPQEPFLGWISRA